MAMYVSAAESQQDAARAVNIVKQAMNAKDLIDSAAIEAIEWANQHTNESRNGLTYQSGSAGHHFSPPKALFSPPKQPISRNTSSVFNGASPSNLPSPWRNGNAQQQNAYMRSLSLPQPVSEQFANGISNWPSAYYASPNGTNRINSTCGGGYALPPPPAHTSSSSHATPFGSPNAKTATSLSNGLLVSSCVVQQNGTRVSPQFTSPHSLVLLGDAPYSSQRFADAQLDAFAAFSKQNGTLTADGSNGTLSYDQFGGNVPVKNSSMLQLYPQDAAEYDVLVHSLRDEAGCGDSSSLMLNGSNQPPQHQKCFAQSGDRIESMPTPIPSATPRGSKRVQPIPKVNKADEFDDDFELPSNGSGEGDHTRVERKRYRNRVAARKCRARKMQRIVELEDRARSLRDEIAVIQERARKADEQVRTLRARISEHVTTGCSVDYESTDALVKSDAAVLGHEITRGSPDFVKALASDADRNEAAVADRRVAQLRGDYVGGDQSLYDAASSTASYAHDALSSASRTPESVKSVAPSFTDAPADLLKQEDVKVLLI